MAYRPGPNESIRSARLALRSPSGSGRPLSRQELAEAVNAYLCTHGYRQSVIHAGYIGKLERGQIRWPSTHNRAALRALLGKATDAELGFFIIQGHANDPDAHSVSSPPDVAPAADDAAVPPTVVASTGAVPGDEVPDAPAAAAAMQVSVDSNAAVMVVCHDGGPPGCVTVVAGPVRVLIDPFGVDQGNLPLAVVGTPMMVGGACVYPISQRPAQPPWQA